MRPVRVQVVNLGFAFQQHDLLHIPRLDPDGDHRAPDAHHQGCGLDIQGFVFVQFFRYVHKNRAPDDGHLHMTAFPDELKPGFPVEGNDFCIVQADGGVPVRTGLDRFAAPEMRVRHRETGLARRIVDRHLALRPEETDGVGFRAFSRRSYEQKQRGDKHSQ